MDILKIIEAQISQMKVYESSGFLDQIYNHLCRAELYYNSGLGDDHYFNDVVYRTNQAFEGALKEAYKVLGGKTEEETNRTTPYNIEKYFKENNIFKDRVLKLFENYRQEWRNKSTHDYKLILDENEAFLALINVTSFVHLLLKQTQEKIAYDQVIERESSESIKSEIQKLVSKEGGTLLDKVAGLVRLFNKEENISVDINEIQVIGMLSAFLAKSDHTLEIATEPLVSSEYVNMRPDFIISDGYEKIILEVKKSKRSSEKATISQIAAYQRVTGIKEAIVYSFASSREDNRELDLSIRELTITNQLHRVLLLT